MSTFSIPQTITAPNLFNSQPSKVVVIDDHALIRTIIVDLMSLEGYQVTEFDSGVDVIKEICQIRPDLIVLDIVLTEGDGFQICQKLRQNTITQFIPVIFISASTGEKLRIKAKSVGANDFVNKPINPAELSFKTKSLIADKKTLDNRRDSYQVLLSLAALVETKISFDYQNSALNLQNLVREFGRYLSLSQEKIDDLELASHLHDIGLLKVEDSLLVKREALTQEERKLIQEHVLTGEQICKSCFDYIEVLQIIRHHHERWDGQGYPDGLVEDEIPYLAQVFQILDIYSALTSCRPYRSAYTSKEALDILLEEANEGWRNPKLVYKFYMFLKKNRPHWLDR